LNSAPNFYRTVLNHMNEGVYFVDTSRVITFWSSGAEKITGYSENEVLHKPCHWNLLMHTDKNGENLCQGQCPVSKTLLDGAIREETIFLQHKQGYRVPISVRVLPMRNMSNQIVGAVEIFSDLTPSSEHGKKMKALATLAYFDLVTGLPNRRYIESRIGVMLTEYKKNLSPFSLLLINIVGFKMLNDKYGPEIGDQVLRSVARNVAAGVGPEDIIGRWDGTRFLVISPNTKKTLLILLAEKLKTIASRAVNSGGSDEIALSVSMSGTINRMDDTPVSIQQRLAAYIQDSEAREWAFVMDEE
jgi:diguanylate cyclase (GGDEF)-like protein/PAS domain S-box-containing protein